MPRRQLVEDPVSHERWLVSYADFITLLFAFFVVMYSVSQVNENKYRVLSNTLTAAFNQPERTLDPFQVGEIAQSNPLSLIELEEPAIREREGDGGGEREGDMPDEFREISERIEQAFGSLADGELVTMRGNEDWLEIEMQSSLLFETGDARLTVPALQLLADIAETLKTTDNPLRVEGFTDDVPISTARFPSNWELSAARASAVVKLFAEEGIDPGRLAAVGYGEFQPVADNSTEAGRARNRRVVLMVSKTGQLRPNLDPIATEAESRAAQTAAEAAEALSRGELPQPPASIADPAPAPEDAPPAPPTPAREASAEAGLRGVRRVEKPGGGLLFTSDENPSPPREPD